MGADIHVYLERLNKKDKAWEPVYIYNQDKENVEYYYRDYCLFGLLAGVRGENLEDFTCVRGLPGDVSTFVQSEYDKYSEDFHGATWYTYYELLHMKKYLELAKKIVAKNDDDNFYVYDIECQYNSIRDFIMFIQVICAINSVYNMDNLRVIVWFDS